MEMSKPAHSNMEIDKMQTAHYNAFNAQLENAWSASQKSGHAKLLDVHKYNTMLHTLKSIDDGTKTALDLHKVLIVQHTFPRIVGICL
jgi:hypothetical protein